MPHTRLTVQIYTDSVDEYRWRLVSRNGRRVADSAEGYTSRAGILRALAMLSAHAERAFEDACAWPDAHTAPAGRIMVRCRTIRDAAGPPHPKRAQIAAAAAKIFADRAAGLLPAPDPGTDRFANAPHIKPNRPCPDLRNP